ncbi:CapA family protein [Butyrivibrio sp. CB08]|uniref:CapA family protein n=1 Tax=Butyrivibrio sp. CB08 TaxID=2364879 RepID=UPI001313F7B3|nr:CapA family protein [Butyrivibrio sp. CB08]
MRKKLIAHILALTVFLSVFLTADNISFAQKTAEQNSDITIVMVGDILLHTPVEEAARNADGSYNFDFIFQNLKADISAADLAIVNQEVIIGGQELGVSGYPSFNAPYQIGDALINAGFDVVCHGTNHALDKGKSGVLNCLKYWKQHPLVTVLGINETEAEYNTVSIFEKKGIKIAILNYTYGTNGIPQPKDMPHAVDMLEKEKVVKDLKFAEENADFTIVCPHWGTEYKLEADSSQKYWTDIFRKNGADLVLGTHPHVIEPIEMLEDDNAAITNNHGDGDMLVYYSLGNFVNWTSGKGKGVANRMVGGMANVKIGKNTNGEIVIKDHGITPVVCHLHKGHEGVIVYPLKDYTDELGKENEIVKQDPSFSAKYTRDLCNKVW